jgi:hypothetical protein
VFAELGFDESNLHHVGQDLEAFIDAFGDARPAGDWRSVTSKAAARPVVENAVRLLPRLSRRSSTPTRRLRRLRGLTDRLDYLGGIGVLVRVADAVLRVTAQGRRLRHLGLLRVDPRWGRTATLSSSSRTARDRGIG